MKRYKKIIILIILIPVIFIFSCNAYNNSDAGIIRGLERKYKISFPKDVSLEYYYKSDNSFHGDGVKYYVLKFNITPSLISDFKSNNLKDVSETIEKNTVIDYFEIATTSFKHACPTIFKPDWNKDLSWNDGTKLSGLRAAYDPELGFLFISIVTQ